MIRRTISMALHWQILWAMLLGAGLGISLNASLGSQRMDAPLAVEGAQAQLHSMSQAATVHPGTVWIEDTPNQVLIEIRRQEPAASEPAVRRVLVRGKLKNPVENWPAPARAEEAIPRTEVPTLKQLKAADPEAYILFQLYGRSTARRLGDGAKAIGDLFLRLLKMVSVPLIVVSLVTGVTGLGRAERLGQMFGRTLLYYVTTSMLAIVTGMVLVNLIQPGASAKPADPAPVVVADAGSPALQPTAKPREGKSLGTVLFEQLHNMIPTNPFGALAGGNFLSIISFSLAFGVFTILVGGKTAETISELAEASFEVIMRMTMAIIRLAPLGVLFLMLSVTASQGVGVFAALGMYMVTVACGLLAHACITMPVILKFVARRSPPEFAKAMSPALLTAFSSASSNGTLPLTMTCAEERAGVSNRVTSFVLPLGATINMDGTALYEVVAVLFIAQLTPGIDLTIAEQVIVAVTALLASIGAAGIPHAGLIMMVIILQAVGLPTESQGLIIAVDRVLDMLRTSVNVWSDSCGCAVISRFEVNRV